MSFKDAYEYFNEAGALNEDDKKMLLDLIEQFNKRDKSDEVSALVHTDIRSQNVVYNPKKTNLIRLAEKLNLRHINGVDMLVWQAYEAEKIWTGRTPDFKDMKIAALENL